MEAKDKVKYTLTEKTPSGIKENFKNKFFFQKGEVNCFKLDAHIDRMKFDQIDEVDLYLAKREVGSDYFFCTHFVEVGEKGCGCGKECESYSPRNGKSGACKHLGSMYEQTDRIFTLKLIK